MAARSATEISAKIEAHVPGTYGSGRQELRESLQGLFASALIKPPRLTGSQWAETYGRIPKGTGAESGPVTLYGYQRGLIDAMCDPRVPLISVVKAARVGYTRLATLAIGYHLHHDPTLCAVAQPVREDAEDFGGTEIAPMLRETPVLRRMLRPVRKGQKQDKQTFHRLSNGASVRLVGAASDDAFRRYSARFQFADEIDGDGWTPGTKTQGGKLGLFWTRGETFFDRKQIRGSTPLLEETSRVAPLWRASDQRRYFVPCPHCSAAGGELAGWQYLDWGGKDENHGLKWELTEGGKLADVWYQGLCGHRIDETHKVWMDARGEWRPTNPEGDHAGFHLWTGMSLNANAAWPVIVKEWLDAQKDPATLVQPFLNLRLGRTYRAIFGHEIKTSRFVERREEYPTEVPAGVLFTTAGIDVQTGVNARVEASIYGWGRGHQVWLIGHFVLDGDPKQPEVWASLDVLLKREFMREDGRKLIVQAAAIDSGDGGSTAEVVQFCNERRGRRIWAIKGRSEAAGKRSRVWPSTPSSKLGRVWYMIGGNAARDWAYGSLSIEKPGPRFVHFPVTPAAGSRPIDDAFFGQLTAERPLAVKGALLWDKPKDKAREAGVCFVYAYAAVCGLEASHPGFVAAGRVPDALLKPAEEPAPPADAEAEAASVETSSGKPPETPQPAAAPAPAAQVHPARQHSSFLPPRRPGGWMNRDRY